MMEEGRGESAAERGLSLSSFGDEWYYRPRLIKLSAHSSLRDEGVTVVGAGRLGMALARGLRERWYDVRALVSRHPARTRRAAAAAKIETLTLGLKQLDRLPQAGLLLITTPDDAIAETAERLAALPNLRGRIALHASGALTSEVLAPLRARGFSVGSMHPLMAVSAVQGSAARLDGVSYCIEGDAAAAREAGRVVLDLGGDSFTIKPEQKALYHAAAVMTAGHAVALFDMAAETLERCGLSKRKAQAVLKTLLRSTVDNLERQTPERALTGSFARADVETVRKHMEALRRLRGSDALAVYVLLGEHSLKMAERAGADRKATKKVRQALSKAGARD